MINLGIAFAESKELVEKLPKDADAGDYVKDFRKSKNPVQIK